MWPLIKTGKPAEGEGPMQMAKTEETGSMVDPGDQKALNGEGSEAEEVERTDEVAGEKPAATTAGQRSPR